MIIITTIKIVAHQKTQYSIIKISVTWGAHNYMSPRHLEMQSFKMRYYMQYGEAVSFSRQHSQWAGWKHIDLEIHRWPWISV